MCSAASTPECLIFTPCAQSVCSNTPRLCTPRSHVTQKGQPVHATRLDANLAVHLREDGVSPPTRTVLMTWNSVRIPLTRFVLLLGRLPWVNTQREHGVVASVTVTQLDSSDLLGRRSVILGRTNLWSSSCSRVSASDTCVPCTGCFRWSVGCRCCPLRAITPGTVSSVRSAASAVPHRTNSKGSPLIPSTTSHRSVNAVHPWSSPNRVPSTGASHGLSCSICASRFSGGLGPCLVNHVRGSSTASPMVFAVRLRSITPPTQVQL